MLKWGRNRSNPHVSNDRLSQHPLEDFAKGAGGSNWSVAGGKLLAISS